MDKYINFINCDGSNISICSYEQYGRIKMTNNLIASIVMIIFMIIIVIIFIKLHIKKDDPLRYCKLYKEKGCCHVDGYLCNIENCEMRKEYEKDIDN